MGYNRDSRSRRLRQFNPREVTQKVENRKQNSVKTPDLGTNNYARLIAVSRLIHVLTGRRRIAKAPGPKRHHINDAALMR